MDTNNENFYFATSDEAEAAFYSAFEMADLDLMKSVLADEHVTCIHPNGMPIIGREDVVASWEEILSFIVEPVFHPELIHRSIEGNTAIHTVAERIHADHEIDAETSLVIATNIYIKQKNGWRMMVHHSSLPPFDDDDLENDPSITHDAPTTLQ